MRGYLIKKDLEGARHVYAVQGSLWSAYHRENENVEVPVWVILTKGEGDFWLFGEKKEEVKSEVESKS